MLNNPIGGRYTLIRRLGGGDFRQIYLAHDRQLPGHPTCIVKQLTPQAIAETTWRKAKHRFETAVQSLYTVGTHDQIPRLLAHFEENQAFYLVEEFIPGVCLSAELLPRQPWSADRVIELLADLLSVLIFVQQQQVVHGDIKPSNLLRRNSDRRIVLIDFGAIKYTMADLGDHNTTIDPERGMGFWGDRPSQPAAANLTFTRDLYAVGIVGIQALTGVEPRQLQRDSITRELGWRHLAAIPSGLGDILATMVRDDSRHRYPTATAALAALQALPSCNPTIVFPGQPSLAEPLAWLERGDELFQVQRYREAIAAYDKAIQTHPDSSSAWFKCGIAHDNLQQFQEALTCYDQVVALSPQDELAWFKRGAVLENLQQFEAALACYEQVVQIQPAHHWAWHDKGKVLESLGQFERAVAAYDRAVELKPNFQLAVESRRRLLTQLKQIDRLYDLHHYGAAIALCELAIHENPQDMQAWLLKGIGLEHLLQYEAALTVYEHIVTTHPEDPLPWLKCGRVWQQLGQSANALNCYDRVIELQPYNSGAWHDRAKALETLHHYDEALASYEQAIQLKGGFTAAIADRQDLLERLQQGSTALHLTALPPEESLAELPDPTLVATAELQSQLTELLRTMIPPRGPDPSAWWLKGGTLAQLQHYIQTVVTVCKAIPLPLHDPEVLRWRGNVLFTLGQYQAAIEVYDQAIQSHPTNPHLWCCIANALVQLKRYQEAVACFDRAIQLQPESHSPWYWRGRLLWGLKRHADALTAYEHAINRNPRFQPALRERQQLSQAMAAQSDGKSIGR
jgi:tetratricopeptide (TPR) repeat protein